MQLYELLSTKERIDILREVLNGTKQSEISKKLKISKAMVSKYFKILAKEKILLNGKLGSDTTHLGLIIRLNDLKNSGVNGVSVMGDQVFVRGNPDPSTTLKLSKYGKVMYINDEKIKLIKKQNPELYFKIKNAVKV